MPHFARTFLPLFTAAALLAAGGCSLDDDDDDNTPVGTGQLKLSVTDAPVDGAQSVTVKFTGVELLRSGADPLLITFDAPKSIDLLDFSGTASAILLDQPVPAGNYTQVRLVVDAEGDAADSFITLEDGTTHGLRVPSGSENGLKLVSGFTLADDGVANFTIDFDLRKAVTCPPGQNGVCLLKPALRMVQDNSVGAIAGVVDAGLVPEGCAPGVYLYSGNVSAPEDIDSGAANGANQPIASTVPVVTSSSEGGYAYQFGFLAPGTYTVALTCQADEDDADADDAEFVFQPVTDEVPVVAAQTTTVDFEVVTP